MTAAPVDVKALRELMAQATPGPWRQGSVEKDAIFVSHPEGLAGPGGERVIARANMHYPYEADIAVAVAAVNALPALLDKVERLYSVIESVQAELAEARAQETHESYLRVIRAALGGARMTRECVRCGAGFEVDETLDAKIRARHGEGHGQRVCPFCVLAAINEREPGADG